MTPTSPNSHSHSHPPSHLLSPKTQTVLRVVTYHQVLAPLQAAQLHLALQPAVVHVLATPPTHHVHLAALVLGLHELVDVLPLGYKIGQLSHFYLVSTINLSVGVEFEDAFGSCD
jgi:hypothetical protein